MNTNHRVMDRRSFLQRAAALGAGLGPMFLRELADGRIDGMTGLAALSIMLTLTLPSLLFKLNQLGELN